MLPSVSRRRQVSAPRAAGRAPRGWQRCPAPPAAGPARPDTHLTSRCQRRNSVDFTRDICTDNFDSNTASFVTVPALAAPRRPLAPTPSPCSAAEAPLACLPSRAQTVTTREKVDKWPVYNAVMPILSYGKCVSLSKQLITNLWLRP